LGAGELLVTSIDQDGSLEGYDTGLISIICCAVDVPVIASGGAGSVRHATQALAAGAQAAAAGSMLVYQRALRSVLVHYPARKELRAAFTEESVREAHKR
jgi:imidazole glycerol-phosphate synthase subunit HisF